MMVSEPAKWVEEIKEAGGDQFTFHLESTSDPDALIDQIRAAGMKVGDLRTTPLPLAAAAACFFSAPACFHNRGLTTDAIH